MVFKSLFNSGIWFTFQLTWISIDLDAISMGIHHSAQHGKVSQLFFLLLAFRQCLISYMCGHIAQVIVGYVYMKQRCSSDCNIIVS